MSNLHSIDADLISGDPYLRRTSTGFPLLPGGYGRSAYHVGPPSSYAVRGEGWRLWDQDGREFIDANGNFTTLIHGNAHPELVEAAERVIRAGSSWGIPNAEEWELADRLLARLPGLDQVRFTNSGTEAVMAAIRIARGATGRDDVIMTKHGYHGSSDLALSTSGPVRGVPKAVSDALSLLPVNDIETLRRLFAEGPRRYAAIVLDLIPNKAGLIPLDPTFVAEARELATKNGTLLIIDEVISIRLGANGLSGEYGVTPDLLTTGKLIGGGFPVGAVAGTADVMTTVDPRRSDEISLSGTFSGNPVSMAAGTAALRLLDEKAITRLNALGNVVRAEASFRVADAGWEFRGQGSLLRPFPKGGQKVAPVVQRALWWAGHERGVIMSSANLVALSTPMSGEVIADLADRLVDAVIAVADSTN
ncbi:aspartate aminotransferase family protein [Microbacterium sp.]|uniref:aspartate aminotransferase family protein n=1 Tax=Microbacterium sp. TaxID=51671 RepID=UPI003A95C0F0